MIAHAARRLLSKGYRKCARIFDLLFCALFFIVTNQIAQAEPNQEIELRIALNANIIAEHPGLLEGDACKQLQLLRNRLQRPPVDLLLICRTIELSDTKPTVKIISSPSYARSIRMVKKGVAHTMAESVWFSDIDSDYMYHTGPVLEIGDFEKGIYVGADHPLLKKWQGVSQLRNFKGITLRRWGHDWDILNLLTSKVVPTSHYESLMKMIDAGRGDFTLHEFSQTKELDIVAHGVWMKPLPGIKIVMPESRVIPISASERAENASIIANIIKEGVQQLNATGEVHTLYSAVGFNNPTVKNWKIINIPELQANFEASN